MPIPVGHRAPHLAVETRNGKVWSLREQPGSRGDLVFFFQDINGPPSLHDLAERVAEFAAIAIAVTAIVPHSRATRAPLARRRVPRALRIGYDPLHASHREWGIPVPNAPAHPRPPPIGAYLVSASGEILISSVNIGHVGRLDLGLLLENARYLLATSPPRPAPSPLLGVRFAFPGGRGAPPVRTDS